MAFAHDELLRFAAFSGACAPVIPLALGLAGFGRPSRELSATAFVAGALAGLIGSVTYFIILAAKAALVGWPQVLAEGFLGAAIPEELAKYIVLVGIVCAHEDCDIGLDVILGAGWIGLGFAALENVLYVLQAKNVYNTGLVRAVMAVPFHVSLGLLMGCCLVMARQNGRRKLFWSVAALALPMLLHGVFDSALFSRALSNGVLSVPAASVFVGTLVLTAGLIATWSVGVIARYAPQRLQGRGRPIGALVPTDRGVRIGRWLAVGILGLFAAAFALGFLTAGSQGRLVEMLVGSISIFLLGFAVFFWRGPTKFALRAQYLYGESEAAGRETWNPA
jgi:RsiW-degrading membrane proteinase PrsW (M82 family)